ncbi:hypothetical protein [Haladaptatus caseinilyticus]|uniref:hypothetical protein n=1 Tax=Haladaptatus caseinilyticus TaxID=2993314 RepID=UPI00224A6A5D|nr:hypothetical protein [Haladaptatus caseinilyticus]
MKFKLVPEAPAEFGFVADAQRAVPLVPGTEDDCCARLMNRLDFPSRDVARTWLTFLRALELAEETQSGYARLRRDPNRDELAEAFESRVYGVSTVLSVLDEHGPLTEQAVFERFREEIPTWERHKDPTRVESVWRERVGNILDWSVLFGLAEHVNGEYRRV